MTVDTLSNIVEQSLNSITIDKLEATKADTMKEQILALVKLLCKDYLGAAESELKVILNYKEGEFFRKYACYLLGLIDTSVEERHQFSEEIQQFSFNIYTRISPCPPIRY